MELLSTLLWLTVTIFHESRGEEHLNQLMVAHTILNRSTATGESVKDTVLKDKQFSCFNSGVTIPTDIKALSESFQVAKTAILGKDFTGGALYYHSVKVKPKWRKRVSYIGRFGNHIFYKDMVKIKKDKVKRVL